MVNLYPSFVPDASSPSSVSYAAYMPYCEKYCTCMVWIVRRVRMAAISCSYLGPKESCGNTIAIRITMANDPATTQRILFKTLGTPAPPISFRDC